MGQYGPIRWPQDLQTLDLNSLDFFFWGCCKELIYETFSEDAENLETRCIAICRIGSKRMLWKMYKEIYCHACKPTWWMVVILNIFYKIFSSFSGHLKQSVLFRTFNTICFFLDERSFLFESNPSFLGRLIHLHLQYFSQGKMKRKKNERNVREILTLQKTSNMQHYFIVDFSSFAIGIITFWIFMTLQLITRSH